MKGFSVMCHREYLNGFEAIPDGQGREKVALLCVIGGLALRTAHGPEILVVCLS